MIIARFLRLSTQMFTKIAVHSTKKRTVDGKKTPVRGTFSIFYFIRVFASCKEIADVLQGGLCNCGKGIVGEESLV